MATYHYAAEHAKSNRRADGLFDSHLCPSEGDWLKKVREFLSGMFDPPVPADELHISSLTKLKD